MKDINEFYDDFKAILKLQYGIEFAKASYTLNHLSQIKHITGLIRPIQFVLNDMDNIKLSSCNSEVLRVRLTIIIRETDDKATYELSKIVQDIIKEVRQPVNIFNNLSGTIKLVDQGFDDLLTNNNLIHSAWIELDFTL